MVNRHVRRHRPGLLQSLWLITGPVHLNLKGGFPMAVAWAINIIEFTIGIIGAIILNK